MERDAISQYTVLGTLVDRAVCMPYARPQVLREGRRRRQKLDGSWETMASVQEDVALAADFIVRSLKSPGAQERWSPAELALDAGGPWWAKTRDVFFHLQEAEQEWVLDRLPPTAATAASAVESGSIMNDWSWLWSQPTLATPGKLRPRFRIPDLIGGVNWKECDVIDLKTTIQTDLRAAGKKMGERGQFEKWKEILSAMRFEPRNSSVLIVSSLEDDYEWVAF